MRLIFWIMFAVMLGVYLVMVLWSLPLLMADAGGLPAFDLRPAGYSHDEAQAFLAALSPEGRAFYLDVQQWLDTAYPALLGVVLVMAFGFYFAAHCAGLRLCLPWRALCSTIWKTQPWQGCCGRGLRG